MIYLICDQLDLDATPPLEDYLFDRGYEIITPVFEGDAAQVLRDHEENLRLCDAALVYYGAGSELWLRGKLRELLKSAGFGRQKPFLAKAVYVAHPGERRLRAHGVEVIQASGDFVPASLVPFLRRIEKARSGPD